MRQETKRRFYKKFYLKRDVQIVFYQQNLISIFLFIIVVVVILVVGKMSLEFVVPFFHSVDLVVVVFLAWAGWEVSRRPFWKSSRDLFNSNWRIFTIISDFVINVTSFSVIRGASVGQLVLVVKSTSLVATFEVFRHTGSVVREFVDPVLLGWKEWEPENNFNYVIIMMLTVNEKLKIRFFGQFFLQLGQNWPKLTKLAFDNDFF